MSIGHTSAQMALRDPDIRLMLRVRDDDSAAFAELVERFQARMISVMHHLLGDAQEAEDLAQEVFLRVYRHRKKYRPKAKFATWLFTIANHLALNVIRHRKRRSALPLELNESGPLGARPEEQLVADRQQPPTQQLQHEELAAQIRRALDSLNERQRMAVILNKFEDMNYAEIAEVMGLSTKAVKSLLCRARTRLRDALKDYVYMDGQPVPAPEADDTEAAAEAEEA